MSDLDPLTNTALLRRLRDPLDELAWREFIASYQGFWAKVIKGRLSHEDGKDVLQEIYLELFRVLPHYEYDRSRGRFRGWLYVVSKRIVIKALRNRDKLLLAEDIGLNPAATPYENDLLKASWDEEFDRLVVRCALAELYAKTLNETGREVSPRVRQILDLIFVRRMDDSKAAAVTDSKCQDVYNARRRWKVSVESQIHDLLARHDRGEWLSAAFSTLEDLGSQTNQNLNSQ